MKVQIIETYDQFDLPVYAVEMNGRAIYITDDIVRAQDFKQKFLRKNEQNIQVVEFTPEFQKVMLKAGITL